MTVTLFLGVFLVSQPTQAQEPRESDAFALAIQHFNGSHQRPLPPESQESRFMMAALAAVDSAIPILRAAHKGRVVDGIPFRSLWTSAERLYDTTATAIERQEQLRLMAERIGRGCPRDSVVQRQYHLAASGQTQSLYTHDSTTYRFEGTGAASGCLNSITSSLLQHGITYLAFSDQRYNNRMVLYQITIGSDRVMWRDMAYVRSALLADSATAWVAERVQPWDLDMDPVIPPWDILLEGSSGHASLEDTIVLRYSWRTGDCNPGCSERHEWIVEIRPQPPRLGGQMPMVPVFRVRLLREEGSPLREHDRRRIQEEAPLRHN